MVGKGLVRFQSIAKSRVQPANRDRSVKWRVNIAKEGVVVVACQGRSL